MSAITIDGLLGSGAPEIGQYLAQDIRGQYIDEEITIDVAARLQRAVAEVEDMEQPPGSWLGRILWSPEIGFPGVVGHVGMGAVYVRGMDPPLTHRDYLGALNSVIKELARSGNIVIQGHGSQFVLKYHPRAFHVLTVAPLGLRVARVMSLLELDGEAARKEIRSIDSSQRAFVSRYFRATLEYPGHYDLVINTDSIDFESAAHLITDTLTFHWGSQKLVASGE